ncbi:glycine zipper 2TM domain-containing protein [Ramlibacter alkalitolerans]|uniref:Glycine zipper 2TM domain-containing protein n=1 Tax=Ramlibacter alkalitolerans TaxID=2039631 RepID=A0ABS1JUF8_9BURK|nr:glycine zipper 2TM domain-containing protein [Ramlibacter alkalitolerans]MBL0427858.1 glycine zipper 2TM domain-containing protein [Ramlibacter alkalitolerans]
MKRTALFAAVLALVTASAFAQSSDYAQVRRVTAQTKQVPASRQVCEERMVQQQVAPSQGHTGAVVGTVIGGVIGSRFGKGDGRIAATAVGAGLGAVLGNNHDRDTAQPATTQMVPTRECRTETVYEQRIDGYLVEYEYAGRVYSSVMANDPGDRIRVTVSVTPAR